MANAWFRMYSEAVDDDKLKLLSPADRWHFVALLCCKNIGIVDEEQPPAMMRRRVAARMSVSLSQLDAIAKRLAEVGIIDPSTLQPTKWEDRQFTSDTSADRMRRLRARNKGHDVTSHKPSRVTESDDGGNVTVTRSETETETETDTEIQLRRDVQQEPRFRRPTADELRVYFDEIGLSEDPQRFIDFYESKGWKVGKTPMSDWKAAARTWLQRRKAEQPESPPPRERKQLTAEEREMIQR